MSDERAYPPRPICGVGIVAFHGESVLLVRRGKEPRRGEWSIPGGAVELGERVRDAARREFAEECSGDIELQDLVEVVDIITRDEAGRVQFDYVVVDFWAEWRGGTLAPASDALEARWVLPGDLDAYALPEWTRAVVEKAIRARARR